MNLTTYYVELWVSYKNISDNYIYVWPRFCAKHLKGPKFYPTLIEAQIACSADKTCSGIVKKKETSFHLCYGVIYKSEKQFEYKEMYMKESQYGKY